MPWAAEPPPRRRTHRRKLAALARDLWIRASLALLAAGGLALGPGRLRPVWTPSIPMGIYRMTPLDPGRPPGSLRGEVVQLCLPAPLARWVSGYTSIPGYGCPGWVGHLAKLVVAAEGDHVVQTQHGITVNGVPIPRSGMNVGDGQGGLLRAPGAGPGVYDLRPGEVWLYSPDPRSLDSRILGPIPADGIQGTLRPLWTANRVYSSAVP